MFYSVTSNLKYIPHVFPADKYWFYEVYAWGRGSFQVEVELLQLYQEHLHSLHELSCP